MVKNRPGCKFARVNPGRCRAERLELRGGGEAQAVSTGTRHSDVTGRRAARQRTRYGVAAPPRARVASFCTYYYSTLKLHVLSCRNPKESRARAPAARRQLWNNLVPTTTSTVSGPTHTLQ